MTKLLAIAAAFGALCVAAAAALAQTAPAPITPPPPTVLALDVPSPTPQSFWGKLDCAYASRHQRIATGGDPGAFHRLTVRDGDNYYGERCELGQNALTGPVTFYRENTTRTTRVSYRLPAGFPLTTPSWQVVMQMKQTQPATNGGGTPVLALEVRGGRWVLTQSLSRDLSSNTRTLWSAPAHKGVWTDVWLRVSYSPDPEKGRVRIAIDADGNRRYGPGERSPTFKTFTLKRNPTGRSIPSHLRVGIYHDPTIRGTSIDIDNVTIMRP